MSSLPAPPLPGPVAAGEICDPDNISSTDQSAAAKASLVCQLTDVTETVMMPAEFQNALKGDVILTPGGTSVISQLFRAMTPQQYHSHSGIMARTSSKSRIARRRRTGWASRNTCGGLGLPRNSARRTHLSVARIGYAVGNSSRRDVDRPQRKNPQHCRLLARSDRQYGQRRLCDDAAFGDQAEPREHGHPPEIAGRCGIRAQSRRAGG